MATLVKGPFSLKWGDTTLTDIEEISVDYSVDTEDFKTIEGQTYEIAGAHKAVAELTLLGSDIPSLAAMLPQYFVENGDVLSTGETIDQADGAIDIVPGGCSTNPVYNHLDIIACGSLANVARMVNARTEISGMEISGKIRKVKVRFIGEPDSGDATLQFFRSGTIAVVS